MFEATLTIVEENEQIKFVASFHDLEIIGVFEKLNTHYK